mgnify:CR=1 FL=1|jgi:hypothetical protein
MNITKQIIIDKAESSQGLDNYMYNLHFPIGQYILSIAVGEGNYCSPRELLDDVSEYNAVEVAILDTNKPRTGIMRTQLMSLGEVEDNFGDEVAKLCEGYGYEEPLNACTVLPYTSWDDVVRVANHIRTTVQANKPADGWNDEMCEPF